MNEPITPNQLRRLFPGASKSVLAKNPMSENVAEETKVAGKFSLLVTIPIPNPLLSPNARVHWAQKARLVREARRESVLAVGWLLNSRLPFLTNALVQVRWYSKTSHRQDATNLIARLKATEDGFQEAGLLKDDAGVTWLPPLQFTDKENPRVELLISEP